MFQPRHRRRTLPALLLLCLCSFSSAFAAKPSHWVGTWAASPVATPNRDGKAGSVDTTYREIVHISLGGPLVRIVLTNEFGTESLTIGAAHIALSAGHSDINGDSALTFGGSPSVIIPAGGMVLSDPTPLNLPPFANLAISLFIPAQPITQLSAHFLANQTNYTAPGNLVSEHTLPQPEEVTSWPILKGVDVLVDQDAAAIVAFGDSITDGTNSTRSANNRWPDVLARRLHENKKTANLAILNEGIAGNRILHDNNGPNALSRFDRDVLSQPGVKYVVFLESINDIGRSTAPTKPYDFISAQDLIGGLTQLAERAHVHGIKVIGGTLTPYAGANYQSPAGETMRQAVNDWIRTTKEFDGVIDFDKITLDPANPTALAKANDSGDHLHPNDTGYKVMGEAIDLNLFTSK